MKRTKRCHRIFVKKVTATKTSMPWSSQNFLPYNLNKVYLPNKAIDVYFVEGRIKTAHWANSFNYNQYRHFRHFRATESSDMLFLKTVVNVYMKSA